MINIRLLLKNLHSAGKGHDIRCITEGHGTKESYFRVIYTGCHKDIKIVKTF